MFPFGRVLSVLYFCLSVVVSLQGLTKVSKILKDNKMTKNKTVQQEPNRPQTPKPPFPYREEEVSYENKTDGLTLSGTLTIPDKKGSAPVALLVSGMGPNDRDYSMLGHKLFLVLADYLTRHGIAVLRVDKRGVGKSTGTFDATVTCEDLARDVQAGIAYLKSRKDISPDQIGLIGHSEGGMIASMVAADCNDVAFLVLMAAVATISIENVLRQVAMQLKADGATEQMIAADSNVRKELLSIVKQEANSQVAESKMRNIMASYFDSLPQELKKESELFVFTLKESHANDMISFFNSSTYRYWLSYNPITKLKRVTVPVLALNGDLDFVAASKIQLPIITHVLQDANNDDASIVEIPKTNHWFQTCATGAMAEYGALEETISPAVLKLITDWVLVRVI